MKYLNFLADKCKCIFLKYEIIFNINGIDDIIERYSNVNDTTKKSDILSISKDLNKWCLHIGELSSIVSYVLMDIGSEKKLKTAKISLESSKKITEGTKIAEQNPDVIELLKMQGLLEALKKALEANRDFFERAYYQTKMLLDIK